MLNCAMDDGAVGHLLSREIWYGAQSHHPCQWVIVEVRWWRQCCADGLTGSFGSSGGLTKQSLARGLGSGSGKEVVLG